MRYLSSSPSWVRWSLGVGAMAAVALVSALIVDGEGQQNSAGAIRTVDVVRDPDNPLRGELRVRTSEPATLTAEVRSIDGHGFRVSPPGGPTIDHTVPILGLAPDRGYSITLELNPQGTGTTVSADAGALRTGPLPDDFPPVEVVKPGPREEIVEARPPGDGLTLFDVGWRPPEGEGHPRDHGYLVAVDGRGDIVWYHGAEQSIQDARRTEDGTLLFVYNETGVREVSPTGDLVREWSGTTGLETVPEDDHGRRIVGDDPVRVETDQMHHAVGVLPNGNLITLSREIRTIEYPEAVCDPEEGFDGTYEVGGDVVVEFDPDTGEVVKEFSLFDVLDPLDNLDRTKPYEFCSRYLESVYPERDARDWTHANAVVLDEDRNALVLSLRHTDSLVALRYADDADGPAGELLWTLGEDGDFELTGDGEWFFHQHAPEIQPDGSILLYDNGNERPGTSLEDGDPAPYSRAVRYRLDLDEGSAEQVWEHRAPPGEEPFYAPYVGDADRTGDDTVLVTHGGLVDPPSHSPVTPGVQSWGRILEVGVPDGESVLDVRVRDPDPEIGWRAYRAERIPTIYPPGYTVEPLPSS